MPADEAGSLRTIRFYLVRHGESANNARQADDEHVTDQVTVGDAAPSKQRKSRQADPGLTAKGEAQARAAGLYFGSFEVSSGDNPAAPRHSDHRVREVWSSAMRRALGTTKHRYVGFGQTGSQRLPELHIYPHLHEEGGVFKGERANPSPEMLRGLPVAEIRDFLGNPAEPEKPVDALGATASLHAPASDEGWWIGGVETVDHAAWRARHIVEQMFAYTANHSRALAHELDDAAHPNVENDSAHAVVIVSHGLFFDRLFKIRMGIKASEHPCFILTQNCGTAVVDIRISAEAVSKAAEQVRAGEDVTAPDASQRSCGILCLNKYDYIPSDLRHGHTCGGFAIRGADIQL